MEYDRRWPEQLDTRLCLKTRSYGRQSVVSPLSGDRSYVGVRLFRQSLEIHSPSLTATIYDSGTVR